MDCGNDEEEIVTLELIPENENQKQISSAPFQIVGLVCHDVVTKIT